MSATPAMPGPETITSTLPSRSLPRRASGAVAMRLIPILCWSASEKHDSLDEPSRDRARFAIACKEEAPPRSDQSKQLSRLTGQHLGGCIGVFLRGFVVALQA